MDTIEAIEGRRSVRAFKRDPVPKDVLEKIMKAALRAPSWENTQPWEFAVLSPGKLNELRLAVVEKMKTGQKPNLDIPWPRFAGPHKVREKALGEDVRKALGLSKEDPEGLKNWWFSMTQFFNAPNAVIAYIDRSLGEWSILDTGLALENLMIAAWHHGVGTCVMSAAVIYPDVLHQLLNIPDSKRMIVGLAVGYPDFDSPRATFRTGREQLDTLVTWHGFD